MTRVVLLIGLAGIAISGCDATDPAEPHARQIHTPQFSSSSLEIYIPPTNAGGGAVALDTVGKLQPGKWGIIKVAGKVTLSKSAELQACDPGLDVDAFGASAGLWDCPHHQPR